MIIHSGDVTYPRNAMTVNEKWRKRTKEGNREVRERSLVVLSPIDKCYALRYVYQLSTHYGYDKSKLYRVEIRTREHWLCGRESCLHGH